MQWSNDAGQLVGFLAELSRDVLRESDFDRLMVRFAEVVNTRVCPARFALFDVVAQSGKAYQLVASRLKFRKDRSLIRESLDQIGPLISSAIESSQSSSDGIQSLKILEKRYQYLMLGDAQFQRWVLALLPEPHEPAEWSQIDALLDFLGRQIQLATAWTCKLDNTQSQLYRDDLTGLYNTRYMEEVLEKEVRRAIRFGSRFCVFFVDLDNLKEVNDRHGHLTGSSVLKQFADLLRLELREVDSLIRYGGDEYIVLLLGADAKVGAMVAERLRIRIDQHQFMTDAGKKLHITCSIGVAAFPEHGKSRDQLLKVADDCMYRGKKTGKNQVIIADPVSIADASQRSKS
jgi:diguanylate cyclase (GGDEF)-like protein